MKKYSGNVGRVLDYLKTHKKGITSMQAFDLFGATRLSAIIFNLRKDYEIESIKCEGKNRYGTKVFFDRYVLKGEINESNNNR